MRMIANPETNRHIIVVVGLLPRIYKSVQNISLQVIYAGHNIYKSVYSAPISEIRGRISH